MHMGSTIRRFTAALVCVTCLGLAPLSASASDRKISLVPYANTPVRVLSIKTGPDHNWLKGFALEIENVSAKSLAYVSFHVTLDGQPADLKAPLFFALTLGDIKRAQLGTPAAAADVVLKPGERTTLAINPNNVRGIAEFYKTHGAAMPRGAEVE